MSFIAPVVQAAGPLFQLAGGIFNAIGQNQQYSAQASIASYNQAVANQNASLIESAARQRKQTNLRRKRAYLSSMQAEYGFRGVNLSGSPLLAMAESASELELDIQNEEFNSLIEANQARSQAQIFGLEAAAYKQSGRIATVNSILKVGGKFATEF